MRLKLPKWFHKPKVEAKIPLVKWEPSIALLEEIANSVLEDFQMYGPDRMTDRTWNAMISAGFIIGAKRP